MTSGHCISLFLIFAFINPYSRVYSFAKVADEINVEKNFYFLKIVNQDQVPDRFRSQATQFAQGLELLHTFDPLADLTSSLPLVVDESGKSRSSYCGGVKTSTIINPVYAKRAPTPTCSSAPILGGPFHCVSHGFGDAKRNNFDIFLPGNFGPGTFVGDLFFRVDTLPRVSAKNRLFNYNAPVGGVAPNTRLVDPMVARSSVTISNRVGVTVSNNNPVIFPAADFFIYRLYDVGIFVDPTQIDDPTYPVLNYTVVLEPARLVTPIDMDINIRTDIPAIIYPLAFAPDLTSSNVILFESTEQSSMIVQHVMELPCSDIPDCNNWIVGSQFAGFEDASTSSASGQRAVLTHALPISSSVASQSSKRFCLTDEFSITAPIYQTRGSFLNLVLDQSNDPINVVKNILDDSKVPRSIFGPESIMLAMLRPTWSEEMVNLLLSKNVPFDDAVMSYAARIDKMRGTRFFNLLSGSNATGYKKTMSKGSGDFCLVRGQPVQPGRRVFFDLPWRFAVTPLKANYGDFSAIIRLDWSNPNIVAFSNQESIKRRQQINIIARKLIDTVILSQTSQYLAILNDVPGALTLASIQNSSVCNHWQIVKFPLNGSLFSLDDFHGPDVCSRFGLKGSQTIAAMFCQSFGFGVFPSSLTSSSQSFLNQLPWNVVGSSQPYSAQASLLMGTKIQSKEQLVMQSASSILNASFYSYGNSSFDKFGTSRNLSSISAYWGKLWSGRLNYGRVLVDSNYAFGDHNTSFYSNCGLSGVEGLILNFSEVVQPKSLILKASVQSDVSLRILARTMPRRQHHRYILHDDQPTTRVIHTRKTYIIDYADNSTVSELSQQVRPKTLLASAWSHVDSETNEGWVELWSGTARKAAAIPGQSLGELKFVFCLPGVAAWLETRTLIVESCGSIGRAFGNNLDSSPLEGGFVATLYGTKGGTSSGRVVSSSAKIVYM